MSTASPIRPAIAGRCAGGSGAGRPGWWSRRSCCAARRLPRDWACDGTTGYDFMNDVSALQHDAAGEAPLADGLGGAERPAGRVRARGTGGAARDRGAKLLRPARSLCGRLRRAGETRPADLAPRADRAAGAFPGLSHLRRRRRPLAGRPHGAAAGGRRRAQDLPRHRPLGCRRGPAPVRARPPARRPSRASSN